MAIQPDLDRRLPTTETIGYAPAPRPVVREDWFWTQGPLGVMALLLLVAVAVLWRRLVTVQREAAEREATLQNRLSAQGEAHAEKIAELTRDHAAQVGKLAQEGYTLAGSVRDVLEATKTRIVR